MKRYLAIQMIPAIVGSLLMIVAAGCDDVPPQSAQDQPTERIAIIEGQSSPDEEATEAISGPPVELQSWPGQHQQMTFDLTWLGGDEALELRDRPDSDQDVVEAVSVLDGEQLDWHRSVIEVQKPRPYTVLAEHEVFAIPYDPERDELEDRELTIRLTADEKVYLYQYMGEGDCLLFMDEQLVVAQCPGENFAVDEDEGLDGPDLDDPSQWKALSETWWVKIDVEGKLGWFVVSQAPVDVHLRSMEGYDDIDGRPTPPPFD